MSNVDSIKADLLGAPWRKHKDVKVEGRNGLVELVIRRPPPYVLEELLVEARALKENGNAEAAAAADESALGWLANVVSKCVWLPNAVAPLFTAEEARRWPSFQDVQADCLAAIGTPAHVLEKMKGNSEVTPTSA